jgi:transposase
MDKSKREKRLGPGKYELDPSLKITRIEDLPKAIERTEDRVKDRCACPTCGTMSPRTYTRNRKLYDIGDLTSGRPCQVTVKYSQHRCERCTKYFSVDTHDLAEDKMHYTRRVMNLAILAVIEDRLPYREASWRLWRDHGPAAGHFRVFVPFAPDRRG